MFKRSGSGARRSLLLCLVVLGLITAVVVLPYQFGTSAAGQKGKGLIKKESPADTRLPNYDIRTDTGEAVMDFLERSRGSVGKNAAFVADIPRATTAAQRLAVFATSFVNSE